jgi:hypothetical protein
MMPFDRTAGAFAKIPLLWLGFKEVILAYLVTALAWYVPLQRDEWQMRLAAPLVTMLTWLGVIVSVVAQTQGSKLFRF